MDGEEGQEALASGPRTEMESIASSRPRLPPEIQRLCIARLDLASWRYDQAAQDKMRLYSSLRLVDRATKDAAATLHWVAQRHFQQSIVVSFIINPTPKRAAEFERMAEILGITEFGLDWCPPSLLDPFDETRCEGFNSFLSICTSLHTLDWDFFYQEVDLTMLKLDMAPSLRHLAIRSLPNDSDLGLLALHRLVNLQSLTVDPGEQMYSYVLPAHLPRRLKMLSLSTLELEDEHVVGARGMLGKLEELGELDMSLNPLGVEGIRSLNLPGFKALAKVNLGYVGMDDAGVTALQLHRTKIKELLLQGNLITDPSLLGLEDNTSLETLILTANPLVTFDFGLDSNTTLQKLDIGACKAEAREPQQFASLSRQLEQNGTLRELDLSYCELDDGRIAGFSVANAKGLELLSLRGNNLTEEVVRCLGIHLNASLKKVSLGPLFSSNFEMDLSATLVREMGSNGCVIEQHDGRGRRILSS